MKVKTKGKQTNTASGVSRKGGVGRFNRLCESFFELEKQHSNDTIAYITTVGYSQSCLIGSSDCNFIFLSSAGKTSFKFSRQVFCRGITTRNIQYP